MNLIEANRYKFKHIFQQLANNGEVTSPRNQGTLETRNFSVNFDHSQRYIGFAARHTNMEYLKEEFKWYINADKNDLSIAEHAKIWKDCIKDGVIESNYGFYLFNENVMSYIVNLLSKDPDSRRGVININRNYHNNLEAKDVPCTMYIGFIIRSNQLFMNVRMRSQDAMYGFYNDLPFFQLVFDIYWFLLKDRSPGLIRGFLNLHVDSFHVYERHFETLRDIVSEPLQVYKSEYLPGFFEDDMAFVRWILVGGTRPETPFTEWLYADH